MVETQSLVSVGRIATILQRGPESVRAAADRAKVRPALILNGIPHFDENDVPKIRRELLRRK